MSTPNSNLNDCTWSPVAKITRDAAESYARLFSRFYPKVAARCNGRIQRAVQISSKVGACRPGHSPGVFEVQSESNSRGCYEVDVRLKTCTCPDFGKHPDVICKHRLAIGFHLYGPRWTFQWQREQVQKRGEARRAAEAAWKAANGLATRYENTPIELFDTESVQLLRSAMIEATEIAMDLERKYQSLEWEKP